jgi:hypothetical protein
VIVELTQQYNSEYKTLFSMAELVVWPKRLAEATCTRYGHLLCLQKKNGNL